jgi:hypothetical protein
MEKWESANKNQVNKLLIKFRGSLCTLKWGLKEERIHFLSQLLTFDRGHGFFQTSLVELPIFRMDEVAEWLRRWTANPMCSARVGSSPILVGTFIAESSKQTLKATNN